MKQVLKKQIAQLKKFNAATSHMYEALFGENSNDACVTESSPDAKQFPLRINRVRCVHAFRPYLASARNSHTIQQLRMYPSAMAHAVVSSLTASASGTTSGCP
jgi:hypothetical protein